MMPCRCRSSTLSLFIRSVAQIDLSATSNFAAAGKLQRPSFKPSSTTRHFRAQHSSTRFYSTSAGDSGGQSSSNASELQHDEGQKVQPTSVANGAFVEFSMDAIDTLIAESEQAPERETQDEPEHGREFSEIKDNRRIMEERENRDERYESPWSTLLKDMPRKKERPADGARVASRSVFREPDSKFYTNKVPDPVKKPKDDWEPPPREPWMIYKDIIKKKFPDGYQPLKRLSPDAIAGIRALHAQMPEKYTSWVLSQEFQVSPEAIRRILKSKWQPDAEEESDRMRRWFKRGEKVWSRYAELGVKPPKKWRDMGIGKGKPEWMVKKNAKFSYDVPPLPALITTARRKEQKPHDNAEADFDSLASRIL